MSKLIRFLVLSVFLSLNFQSMADASKSSDLVEFDSEEGMRRFENSKWKVDFFKLANQFEAQSNALFCGPTTAAILLNAKFGIDANLPRDRSRLHSYNLSNLPQNFDPSVGRFTQEYVVTKSPKDMDVVFGKVVLNEQKKEVKDFGYQLRQFEALLQAHGLKAEATITPDDFSVDKMKKDFKNNLKTIGDYIVVNYKRSEVGQSGGGHISPVAAYDEKSDSFLILDVNPSKAKWVWMSAETLAKGMKSFDTVENRGFIVVN